MREPTVHVSIVIGSNEALVFDCLDSIVSGTRTVSLRLTVTANPASSATFDRLRAAYPGVQVIRNDRRLGFAVNHNRVLAESASDYVLVLNDDTTLHHGAIDAVTDYLEAHPDVAIAGARLLNTDGTHQHSAYAEPRVWQTLSVFGGRLFPRLRVPVAVRMYSRAYKGPDDEAEWTQPRIVHSVKGAFMLVRRDTLACAGYMDEVTDVYEEVEWQHRFGLCGWKVAYVPSATVTHYGGITIGGIDGALANQVKAALNYYQKHGGRFRWPVFRAALCGLLALRAATLNATHAAGKSVRDALRGAIRPSVWLTGTRRWYADPHSKRSLAGE